jgi:hypothetical protein
MGKGATTGKSFLEGVLSKITDPEQRRTAEAVFANPVVQVEIGNGVEGQSEIDRQLQELQTRQEALETQSGDLQTQNETLRAWQQELADWRTANVGYVELGVAARKAGWQPGQPPPTGNGNPPPAVTGITPEQLEAALRNQEQAILGYDQERNALERDHYALFKEIPDLRPLLAHPQVRELGLRGVYNLVHKDALAARATEAATARENEIRADERAKVLAASANQLPYPMQGSAGSGSPLDALGKTPSGSLVEAATAEYQRLQAGRPA